MWSLIRKWNSWFPTIFSTFVLLYVSENVSAFKNQWRIKKEANWRQYMAAFWSQWMVMHPKWDFNVRLLMLNYFRSYQCRRNKDLCEHRTVRFAVNELPKRQNNGTFCEHCVQRTLRIANSYNFEMPNSKVRTEPKTCLSSLGIFQWKACI